jgi:uncharacterized protein (TIGR00290 family)
MSRPPESFEHGDSVHGSTGSPRTESIRTPILVSWSGGKDAAWTLHALRGSAQWNVVGLLTTVTDEHDRVAMHGIRRDVLHAQAAATGLPLIEARQPRNADNATYEATFASALDAARARWPGLHHVAFGDLFLADVRAYRDALCARLGWTPVYPLFGSDTNVLAGDMLAGGLRAVLCCIDTQQLDARFAGREFDADLLADLPATVDRCGERGELHTCVHAGPMFVRPLRLRRGDTVLRDGRFAFTDLLLDDSAFAERVDAQ